MKTSSMKLTVFAAGALACAGAYAEKMDRPVGIPIGERMTLKPYVAVSAAYDSNVDSRKNGKEDVVWTVNPGLGLDYKADTWKLAANVYYQYNAYTKHNSYTQNSYHSFGESLTFNWADSTKDEKGWSLMLTERYAKINQIDDIVDSVGHEYGRDREEFNFAGAIERRFGRGWHADVNGSFYWLDYDTNNSDGEYWGLYGWQRWTAGTELGYAASKWTDILVAASYQGYEQNNRDNRYYSSHRDYGRSSGARGVTVQAGLGSFATERISYRALGGWSRYEYDEGGKASNGFTYSLSCNWNISDTWDTALLATSYFQPTEREYGSSQRVDALSWGLKHIMVRGKLHGTFDVAYRREGREYEAVESYDYDLDIMTFRFGLTYVLNRYLQLYGNLEYRKSINESSGSARGEYYDYDRYRGTIGMRFTY